MIHRDVKPANILLSKTDHAGIRRIYLADFGIARTLDDSAGLTATNFTVGTFAYAAPEQLMGKQVDGRADQYALAATTYHLLTGVPVFPASNPIVAINHHLNSPPPTVGKLRADLAALDPILAKALSKCPDDRYPRCADFARALAARDIPRQTESTWAGPTMQAPSPPTEPPRPQRRQPQRPAPAGVAAADRRASKAMWVAAAAVGVALAALVVVWVQRQPLTSSAPTSSAPPPSTAPRPSTSTQTVTKTVLPPAPAFIERTAPARAPVWVGTITGTCDEGGSCGVKQRGAPRDAAPGITSQPLLDGARVGIVCQTTGDTRQNSGRGSSDVWFQIANGAFIPAVYLATGAERLPQC